MHLQIGDAGVICDVLYETNLAHPARDKLSKITKETPNHSIAKQLLLKIIDVNNYFQNTTCSRVLPKTLSSTSERQSNPYK